MQITDILIRSISGYIFVVPAILLYFLCLNKSEKKQTLSHIIAISIFCYYLIGILTMTGIGRLKLFSPRIVFIPFLDMISDPKDTLLNVLLFVPLGFFLPLLYKKYNCVGNIVLTGFLFSLSIEIVQMFGRGSTDINDLIANTVGACSGFFMYKLLPKSIRKNFRRRIQTHNINAGIEVLLFWTYSFVIMITIQPLLIHRLFRLG